MHIHTDRKSLLRRVNRLSGQITAIHRLIEDGKDEDCYAVMQQLAAARGALDGLSRHFIEGHVREHVAEPKSPTARREGAAELIKTLRSFLR
jgi:DNA-binding FrmR family transcriptional regulator